MMQDWRVHFQCDLSRIENRFYLQDWKFVKALFSIFALVLMRCLPLKLERVEPKSDLLESQG